MNRREFTAKTQREALERSGGICECHLVPQLPTFRIGCGRKLTVGNAYYEHIIPCHLDGGNEIANCAALVKTCFKAKTSTYDLPSAAKVKRNIEKANGIRRFKQHLPGSRRDPFKFTIGSTIPIDRKSGEVWKR